MGRKARHEAHVRLYRHELESPAYQSLSPEARALLVEFRRLYNGRENRVYMSLREMRRRLSVGRLKAERARSELLDRGFIRLLTVGSFSRKCPHASEYALTHEPLENKDGATAPKDFMHWRQKNTVLMSGTDGAGSQHRNRNSSTENKPIGADSQHRQSSKQPTHGVGSQHTDRLPGGGAMFACAMQADGEAQFKLILGALLLGTAK